MRAPRTRKPAGRMARLIEILHLTHAGRGWTAARLAGHFGVSVRRIHEDLRTIESAGFHLVSDGCGYRTVGGALHLPVTLEISDVLALLRPVGTSPRDSRAARTKLSAALPAPLRRLFADPERVRSAQPSSAIDAKIMGTIDAALAEQRRLQIRYRGLKDETAVTRIVEPHALYMRGTGAYLIAWCPERGDIRNFRLDRLRSCEALPQRFERQRDFDLDRELGRSVGAWRGASLGAKVRVNRSLATALESEAKARGWPFHRVLDGAEMGIPFGHIDETAWWLAQFGEGIRVVDPPELRVRLRRIGEEILRLNAE